MSATAAEGVYQVEIALDIMVMSGVDDGSLIHFQTDSDGRLGEDNWTLSIGRREENDLCLRNDTFVSRQHANLHWKDARWWLEDCNSTNGTFTESFDQFFEDTRVKGIVPLEVGQLFRVGRTWLRLQPGE